jgi:hypothetical protein
MYDGTMYGNWKAIVAFQQMIVLCDQDGVVDMTPQAIAARTSIPLEIIKEGITALEAPDEYSRTPGQDGRRLERLDSHRPWGWRIVNYAKYTKIVRAADKREDDRRRIAEKRATQRTGGSATSNDLSQPVAGCSEVSRVSPSVAEVAHIDVDVKDKSMSPAKAEDALPGGFLAFWKTYPHVRGRGSRAASLKVWKSLGLESISDQVLQTVERCKSFPDWTKDGGAYVTAAEVWLRKRLWEQDIDADATSNDWT